MTADAIGDGFAHTLELAAALGPAGVDVVLATMGPRPRPEQRHAAAALKNVRLVESDHAPEWMPGAGDDVRRAGDWLLGLEAEHGPSVMHLHAYAHASLPFRAPVLLSARSCVLSFWRAVHRREAPAMWERYRHGVARGLATAGLVVAPTAAMLRSLQGYGVAFRGRVVPTGTDTGHLPTLTKQAYVLSSGRPWDVARNLAALDRASRSLAWPVLVAGETGTGPPAFTSMRLLGRVDPLALTALLGHAAIFALPARYEPLGLTTLCAARAGCALVLGDVDGVREVWDGAAELVDPEDAELLGRRISELITDEARRVRLAARARARAASYGASRMADGYLLAYRELVERPSTSTSTCTSTSTSTRTGTP